MACQAAGWSQASITRGVHTAQEEVHIIHSFCKSARQDDRRAAACRSCVQASLAGLTGWQGTAGFKLSLLVDCPASALAWRRCFGWASRLLAIDSVSFVAHSMSFCLVSCFSFCLFPRPFLLLFRLTPSAPRLTASSVSHPPGRIRICIPVPFGLASFIFAYLLPRSCLVVSSFLSPVSR